MTTTANGALSHASTGSARLNYFSKALSRDKAHATSDSDIELMAAAAWDESPLDLLKLMAHKRDCRGGAGERHVARVTWKWLANNHPADALVNLPHMAFFGRWDDHLDLVGTPLESAALQLMAEQLVHDMEVLKSSTSALERIPSDTLDETLIAERKEAVKQLGTLSLAAKWAPTEGGAADKHTTENGSRVSTALAQLAWSYAHRAGGLTAPAVTPTTVQTVMKWYRTQILSPLRDATNVVERLMCASKWDEIKFEKVPSKAMSLYARKCFPKHEPERFAQWQADVLAGRAKMNTSQVDPYEVVGRLVQGKATPEEIPTLEAFYQKQVAELRTRGDLGNTVVLADVSGSMAGTPMCVSVAMAIWMSALAKPPYRDSFITFESAPRFVSCEAETLVEKVRKVMESPWGGSTNLQAAFNLILNRAVDTHLVPEEMPRRLIIVSDMQFNMACESNFLTNYEVIRSKYRTAGYTMPEIVFWNVNGATTDCPVTKDTPGVALVGGFSKDLINLFLKNEPIRSPYDLMRATIDAERYSRITRDAVGPSLRSLLASLLPSDVPLDGPPKEWFMAVAPAIESLGRIVAHYIPDLEAQHIPPDCESVIATLQYQGRDYAVPSFQAEWDDLYMSDAGRAVVAVCDAAMDGGILLGSRVTARLATDEGLEDKLRVLYAGKEFLPVLLAAASYYRAQSQSGVPAGGAGCV